MNLPTLQLEESHGIYLLPGDFCFADDNRCLHTVLGSCIAITVWHPVLRIGCMSHSILPNSQGRPTGANSDGRYVDRAIELILHEIGERNTFPYEYQVKLFGGGNMFRPSMAEDTLNVAKSNIEAARTLLKAACFNIQTEHVGGNGYRRIIFDLCDGSVLVRYRELGAL